ncbi:Ig-like domain repeat protein [Nocardioides sp. Bht2]|uniref:Ig-like domain repeat protein n=1 Tax=Nocardioides sp. Bht2 TaxID=3392297 RepID=UPI0039B6B836
MRQRLAAAGALTLGLGLLAATPTPAQAAQTTGHEVPAWNNGWSWTYATTFRYQATGTDVSINENVTYTVAGVETFQGHEAYKLQITGNITGGGGSVAVDGVGNATLDNFSGNVTGTRYVRRSDLAVLQERQVQNLNARAKVSIITQSITANINLELNPQPSWKTLNFPLNPGDSWRHDEQISYTGGFSYDAGSLGGSGTDTFEGTLPFDAPASVSAANVTVPIGTVATDLVSASSADGSTVNNIWYSPSHRNVAREILQLPLDGASLTLTRNLSGAATAGSNGLTASASDSLTCAGRTVTVSGQLASFAAGVPVTVVLDQGQIQPGLTVRANTQTTAGGNYAATIAVPAESDGLQRPGARASWGVTATAGTARAATTIVVTPQNCTELTYTGTNAAEQGSEATVSAQLRDLTGASVAGRTVTFTLGSESVTATANAAGVATAQIAVVGPPRPATLNVAFAQTAGLTAAQATAPFVIGKIGTSVTVAPSESPATLGEPLTFTAHVQGNRNPGGQVQFVVDGADFGGPVALANGAATSASISTLGLGQHQVTARYLGTDDHAASVSPSVAFQVRPPLIVTTTQLAVSTANAVYGQEVTLTATVGTAGTDAPTGTVTFRSAGQVLGQSGVAADGKAEVTLDTLPAGNHDIVATYSGDDVHRASSSAPRAVAIAKATTTVDLQASSTTTVAGEPVHYTAAIGVQAPGGGVPQGSVQLRVGGVNQGAPVTLENGVAVFGALASLRAGQHNVSVVYAGTGNFAGANASLVQQVNPADTRTAVVISPSPSAEGQSFTVTAQVGAEAPGGGNPTGVVTFYADDEVIGAGPLQATENGSQASVSVADLAPGSYQVVARYPGDASYRSSESAETSHTVIAGAAIVPTTTEVDTTANPANFGDLLTFTAQVTAEDGTVPSGMVRFSVDGVTLGGQVVLDGSGVAESTTIAAPEPGDHTVIATFVPDVGFGGSGAILTQTVDAATVSLDLSSSEADAAYGTGLRFTALVDAERAGVGVPSGFVQFSVDGRLIGDAVELVDGEAKSPNVAALEPGNHQVTAVYSGDRSFAPLSAAIEQRVAKVGTTTTVSLSRTSASYRQPVELSATVAAARSGLGSPSGTVVFKAGNTVLGQASLPPGTGLSAVARITLADLPAGNYPVTAHYQGSSALNASSSAAANLTVTKRTTKLIADAAAVRLLPLGLPLGQLRTVLTADGVPLAGAPVVFKVGTTTVCTVVTDGAGVALCNGSSQLLALILNGGYKATYAGDGNTDSATAAGGLIQ